MARKRQIEVLTYLDIDSKHIQKKLLLFHLKLQKEKWNNSKTQHKNQRKKHNIAKLR